MEMLAQPLFVIALAVAIMLITIKSTRRSVGETIVEGCETIQQAIVISRASAYSEAKAELGDIIAILNESDALLSRKSTGLVN